MIFQRLLEATKGATRILIIVSGAVLVALLPDGPLGAFVYTWGAAFLVSNLFHFNPLLELDGYYLLSDAANLPNLRARASDRFTAYVRWLLWGAPHPAAEQRGRFLLLFGIATWVYCTVFLTLMVVALVHWWGHNWGAAGAAAALALGAVVSRGSFSGLSRGEVSRMLSRRKVRAV